MRDSIQAAHRLRLTTCGFAAAVLSLAACGGKEGSPSPADTATASSAAATSSATASRPTPEQMAADQHSMATYPLTVANVEKVTQVMRNIHALEKSDPALKAEWQKMGQASNPKTIDEIVARVNATPRAPEILRSAGISAHDYVYTTFALMYASAAYRVKQSGQSTNSAKLLSQVRPENITFVAEHQKELAALGAANGAAEAADSGGEQ
jgi:hypothetical protein